MAKQERVEILSDLSGAEGAETVTVQAFEIDLTPAERLEFEALISVYVNNGRKVDIRSTTAAYTRQPGSPSGRATSAAQRERNAEIREWASANGYTVPDRGRIPGVILEAYMTKTPASVRPVVVSEAAHAAMDAASTKEEIEAALDVAHREAAAAAPSATQTPQGRVLVVMGGGQQREATVLDWAHNGPKVKVQYDGNRMSTWVKRDNVKQIDAPKVTEPTVVAVAFQEAKASGERELAEGAGLVKAAKVGGKTTGRKAKAS